MEEGSENLAAFEFEFDGSCKPMSADTFKKGDCLLFV